LRPLGVTLTVESRPRLTAHFSRTIDRTQPRG